jgi:hypothetical protein
MTIASYEQEITQLNHLIGHKTPFNEIEQWIDRTPLSEEEQPALWLYAWSLRDTAGQRRVRRKGQAAEAVGFGDSERWSQLERLPLWPMAQESHPRRVFALADTARSSKRGRVLVDDRVGPQGANDQPIPAAPGFANTQ